MYGIAKSNALYTTYKNEPLSLIVHFCDGLDDYG